MNQFHSQRRSQSALLRLLCKSKDIRRVHYISTKIVVKNLHIRPYTRRKTCGIGLYKTIHPPRHLQRPSRLFFDQSLSSQRMH